LAKAAANVHIFASTPVGPFKIVIASVKVSQAIEPPGDGSLLVDDEGARAKSSTAAVPGPVSCVRFAPNRRDGQGIPHWFSFLE